MGVLKYRQKMPEKYKRHQNLYKLIQGAVIDAFKQHPEYIAANIVVAVVVTSITKRVTGLVLANPHMIQESKSLDGLSEAHVKSNNP